MYKGRMLAAVLLLLLVGGFILRDQGLQLYVRLNSHDLEAFASAALADGGWEGASIQYGSWPVSCWRRAGVVEFHIRRSAAFGGVEKGFYYSASDTPAAYCAVDIPLTEEDGGWRWEHLGNHGYTERIAPHWFWFRAVL